MAEPGEASIRECAYGPYEKASRCDGNDVDHWVDATAVLKAKGVGGRHHSPDQPSSRRDRHQEFMLQNTKELYGHKLTATDGEIGHVIDFYFDDKTWVIRYLVVDTGSWLSGRQVLLSPHAFGRVDRNEKTFAVNLTRKQIEGSPSIEQHKPISRQYEIDYYQYYGWPVYWNGGALWGLGGYPMMMSPSKDQLEAQGHHHRDEKHLRSAKAVAGYVLHASDGEIGSVSGFMVDEKSWAVRQLAVKTGHWYAGKKILIPADEVERISYEDSKVFVNLTKSAIQHTAEHEVAKAGA